MDLNGLPPTLAEQEAFLKDPGRLEPLVDDLLARPAYGERWGRHWLDLVRYAETNGYERDATKPNAWRYRARSQKWTSRRSSPRLPLPKRRIP